MPRRISAAKKLFLFLNRLWTLGIFIGKTKPHRNWNIRRGINVQKKSESKGWVDFTRKVGVDVKCWCHHINSAHTAPRWQWRGRKKRVPLNRWEMENVFQNCYLLPINGALYVSVAKRSREFIDSDQFSSSCQFWFCFIVFYPFFTHTNFQLLSGGWSWMLFNFSQIWI